MSDGNLLTDEDFTRVGRVVSRAEHELFGPAPGPYDRDGAATTHVLKVQAGAANASGYPARVQIRDGATGAYADYDTTEVRVGDPNGGKLTPGTYVDNARLVGVNADGVACFVPPWAEAAAFAPGVVSLADQYLGRGVKHVERCLDIYFTGGVPPVDDWVYNGWIPTFTGLALVGGTPASTVPLAICQLRTVAVGGLLVSSGQWNPAGNNALGYGFGVFTSPTTPAVHMGFYNGAGSAPGAGPPSAGGLVFGGNAWLEMAVPQLTFSGPDFGVAGAIGTRGYLANYQQPIYPSGPVTVDPAVVLAGGWLRGRSAWVPHYPPAEVLPNRRIPPPFASNYGMLFIDGLYMGGNPPGGGSGGTGLSVGGSSPTLVSGGSPGRVLYTTGSALAAAGNARVVNDNLEQSAGLDRWITPTIGSF